MILKEIFFSIGGKHKMGLVHNNLPTIPGYKAIGFCAHGYWVKCIVVRKTTSQFISISLFATYNMDILSSYMAKKWEIGKKYFLFKTLVGNTRYVLIRVKEKEK